MNLLISKRANSTEYMTRLYYCWRKRRSDFNCFLLHRKAEGTRGERKISATVCAVKPRAGNRMRGRIEADVSVLSRITHTSADICQLRIRNRNSDICSWLIPAKLKLGEERFLTWCRKELQRWANYRKSYSRRANHRNKYDST